VVNQRVIVTRPQAQAGKWVAALRDAGLDAVSLPLIEIAAPTDRTALQAAWQRLRNSTYAATLFVSANAVEYFFAAAGPAQAAQAGITWPHTTRCFATGPGTVAALLHAGVLADLIDAPDPAAGQFDSEALWKVVGARVQPQSRILIVRGDVEDSGGAGVSPASGPFAGSGRDWFATQVLAQGGACDFVVAYRRLMPQWQEEQRAILRAATADGSVWLFSSSEAIENLRQLIPGHSWQPARALATHPRIAANARAMGFGEVRVARGHITDVIASIESPS